MVSEVTAQAPVPAGALRGQVTDPSGAAIAGATAVMTRETGSPVTATTSSQGVYEFKSLAPGKYSLTVVAQGFSLYENDDVVIADQPLRLNVSMAIEVETTKVQVSDSAPTVDVNPANNAGAIVLSGKELEALPDDPDELLSDLQALAGPSAGPNGGQLYIDGFTAGQLPPKSSIREIRINQNPFSSEYDKLGYGRIEIFTKPGTDKFHGQFLVDGNDSAFNSPSPFGLPPPGFESIQYNGSLTGPLSKTASFTFNVDRRNINDYAQVDTIDPTTLEPGFYQAIANPRQRTNLGPRLDWAPTKNNTITLRYQYYRDTESNNGVGGSSIDFPGFGNQGYDSKTIEHTLQFSDTQILGAKTVNETRFQYLRDLTSQRPFDSNPTVSVLGGFTGGGVASGFQSDHQDHYELQNYTSIISGNHTLKFGGRLRAVRDANFSTSGFNGTFTFPLTQYPATPLQLSIIACENSITGTFSQCSPNAGVTTYDAGLYVQDDWRVRSNITFSFGMRFETQTDIHDHADFGPRLGIAWGVGGRSGPPKFVLRGGSGIFYDRFQENNILQAVRLNGITQQQFIINNPTCYTGLDQPFSLSSLSTCGTVGTRKSSIYQISPSLYSPYTWQSAISIERQITKAATLSVTYLDSRGFDQLVTVNANAPTPGTPCYPSCVTPGGPNLYQFVSEGNFKQHQLIVNTNVRAGTKVQLFGYYTLNYAKSDTAGVSSFASNSYDISQDYGRASFDIHNRIFFGGSILLPYALRLSPFMVVNSGAPFNITVPTDLNGDSIFNDRPGFVSSSTCATVSITGSIYCTPLGTFDALPTASEKLTPVNSATGPWHASLNLRFTRTFGFGPKLKAGAGQPQGGQGGPGGGGRGGGGGPRGPLFGGGGGMMVNSNSDRRYNLTLGVSARNVFNKVNVANPSGVLGSPFFDTPNAIQGGPFSQGSANRRLDLLATFSF
jgi:Carboxypeptidase regulatory-like domain